MNAFRYLLEAVQWGFLGYFILLNTIYVSLALIAIYRLRRYMGGVAAAERVYTHLQMPVSLVVPAYNEEGSIATSVRALLQLRAARREAPVLARKHDPVRAFIRTDDDHAVVEAVPDARRIETIAGIPGPEICDHHPALRQHGVAASDETQETDRGDECCDPQSVGEPLPQDTQLVVNSHGASPREAFFWVIS